MLDAQMLATFKEGGTDPLVVYGVWIPRKGDNGLFMVEVVANYGTVLTVAMVDKNYEDVGNGGSPVAFVEFTEVAGREVMEVLGAKEVVRFLLTLERGQSLEEEEYGWVALRFLQPVWFEAVKV
jgi:hypothetical protein